MQYTVESRLNSAASLNFEVWSNLSELNREFHRACLLWCLFISSLFIVIHRYSSLLLDMPRIQQALIKLFPPLMPSTVKQERRDDSRPVRDLRSDALDLSSDVQLVTKDDIDVAFDIITEESKHLLRVKRMNQLVDPTKRETEEHRELFRLIAETDEAMQKSHEHLRKLILLQNDKANKKRKTEDEPTTDAKRSRASHVCAAIGTHSSRMKRIHQFIDLFRATMESECTDWFKDWDEFVKLIQEVDVATKDSHIQLMNLKNAKDMNEATSELYETIMTMHSGFNEVQSNQLQMQQLLDRLTARVDHLEQSKTSL